MLKIELLYRRYEKFLVIFGAFLLNLTIGNLYSYNNMAPDLVEYMRNYSSSGIKVDMGNAVWIFGMGIFGMGSSVTLGAYFVKKIGPSLTVLLAGWLMSITVLMMAYILNTYLSVVALVYGFINGVGSGIVYGVTIDIGCNWFPNRKGTVAGMIVSGFGLSAFVFDFVQSKFLNHNDNRIANVPMSYVLLGCIFILLQFFGAMLIKNPPKESESSISAKYTSDLFGFTNQSVEVNIRPHNLIMEFDFWILWFTYSLLSACFALIVSLHKDFGLKIHISDKETISHLTIASSVGALCNSLGRVFWGLIIDRFRYKFVMLIITLSLAVLLATFYLPCWVLLNCSNSTLKEDPGTLSFYFVWIILLYLVSSGIFAVFPYVCAKIFGQINFVANYGMLFTAYSFGGVLTSCITTSIWYKNSKSSESSESSESSNQFSLLWAFSSGAVMAILAALVTLLYRGKSLMGARAYM